MYLNIAILYLLVLVTANALSQNEVAPVAQPEDLATVSIIPAKRSFKVGEPIAVTVLLTAGKEGIYVQRGWSQAGAAIPGFYVDLETAHGQQIRSCQPIVDGMPNEEPDPWTVLAHNFIFLRAGEVIGWSTTIDCPPRKRGEYRVHARYSPDRPLNGRIAVLKEVGGRVVLNLLDAQPEEILIR
ncbi:MAG TPA: hypothetical protein VJW94_16510 [Candidatus Acidoferrum sp.]|nr:hypothetical protein [Candidatus Acidoferrum sp.]